MSELQSCNAMEAVAAQHDLGNPDSYTKVTHNSGNDVFVGDEHVIKLYRPEKDAGSDKETDLCRALQGHLPTPEVTAAGSAGDQSYTVMKKLPGQALELTWKDTSEADQDTLFGRMGALLAAVHSVPVDKVASVLDQPQMGASEILRNRAAEALRVITAKRLLSPQTIGSLESYLAEHIPADGKNDVGLRHGCFRFGNILAEGTNITGLLDWEDASLGDTSEELSLTLYRTVPQAYRETFMKGYGAVLPSEHDTPNPVHPLLYYLQFMPDIPTWTQFPGKQAYYQRETANILRETIGEEDYLHNVA